LLKLSIFQEVAEEVGKVAAEVVGKAEVVGQVQVVVGKEAVEVGKAAAEAVGVEVTEAVVVSIRL